MRIQKGRAGRFGMESGNAWLTKAVFVLLQLTWGFPQTLLGFVLFLTERKAEHRGFRGAVHTLWSREDSGISLGLFIFTGEAADRSMITHEYAHTVQSLLLGPLYLFVIGLPSFIWCRSRAGEQYRRRTGKSYFSFYTERWAERLAERFRE